jgi:hypothetical protein
MGYLFLNFGLSKPKFVAVWAYQVGPLTPVQVPHGDPPQILHESLKDSEFLLSCAWRVALQNALVLKFNYVPNLSKIQ